MSWHADHDFAVTISGGSVAGLCNAIVLRKLGATVTVHERLPGQMIARGAGIVVQNELIRLLQENGAGPFPSPPAAAGDIWTRTEGTVSRRTCRRNSPPGGHPRGAAGRRSGRVLSARLRSGLGVSDRLEGLGDAPRRIHGGKRSVHRSRRLRLADPPEDAPRNRGALRRVRGLERYGRGKQRAFGSPALLRRSLHVFRSPQRRPHAGVLHPGKRRGGGSRIATPQLGLVCAREAGRPGRRADGQERRAASPRRCREAPRPRGPQPVCGNAPIARSIRRWPRWSRRRRTPSFRAFST